MANQPGVVVAALIRDLFFGMRIRTVLNQLGYHLILCKSEQKLLDAGDEIAIAIVDFNGDVDWKSLQPLLEGDVPVLAFSSHTNVEGFREAKAAGVTRVVSNGEFSRNLPALLEQYARCAPNSDA